MDTETSTAQRPRAWLLALLGIVLVGVVAYQMWPERQSATPATPSSNRGRTGRRGDAPGTLDPAELKVRLEALQGKRPDQGEVGRNPFRFKPPPAPPAPPKPLTPPAQVPQGPVTPPAPVIPPIPLKFMGTVERGNLKLAAMTDCKGFTYAGREGEIIDARYRLVRIGTESVVMEYPNGTGRTTIRKSGECPK
jgi:hypothetical protein